MSMSVHRGVVTLSGRVDSRQDRQLAHDIAHDIEGFRSVSYRRLYAGPRSARSEPRHGVGGDCSRMTGGRMQLKVWKHSGPTNGGAHVVIPITKATAMLSAMPIDSTVKTGGAPAAYSTSSTERKKRGQAGMYCGRT